MSKKFKVRTAAIFDGNPVGSTIELDEGVAKAYEKLGYLEIMDEVKPKPKAKPKKKPAAKTKAKKATKKKTDSKTKK